MMQLPNGWALIGRAQKRFGPVTITVASDQEKVLIELAQDAPIGPLKVALAAAPTFQNADKIGLMFELLLRQLDELLERK